MLATVEWQQYVDETYKRSTVYAISIITPPTDVNRNFYYYQSHLPAFIGSNVLETSS